MEKYSRFRDPSSGIQVFLPPVLPAGVSSPLAALSTPLGIVLAVVRVLLLAVTALLWLLLGVTIGNLGSGIQPGLTSTFGRVVLFLVGYAWITPELVSLRSRGRAVSARPVSYAPGKSDLIVANWSSWVEVLWLAITFAPSFALPVVDGPPYGGEVQATSRPGSSSAARKSKSSQGGNAGAGGTALRRRNVSSSSGLDDDGTGAKRKIIGFRRVNWLTAARAVGRMPAVADGKLSCQPLDLLLAGAPGPVVLFPEAVTSNNRALLRPALCFPEAWRKTYALTAALRLSATAPKLFLASFKHGAPTPHARTSAVLSVGPESGSGTGWTHPWWHMVKMCADVTVRREMVIRLLHPAESPTSATFIGDAAAAALARDDPISDACLTILASLSRLRRTDIGWQEKEAFLHIYIRR